MKKTIFLSFMLLFVILIGSISTVMIINSQEDMTNRIYLKDEDRRIETLEIKDITLHPGEQDERSVIISGNLEGNYFLTFNFIAVKLNGLEKYLDIEITHNNDYYFDRLNNYFDRDDVKFPIYVSQKESEIKILYKLDSLIGNEAQNTSVDFDIKLIIEKE